MKLHEAIEKLLVDSGRPMTTTEIADALNKNKWYTKRDGSLITPLQIHGRTRNYNRIFKRDKSLVLLGNNRLFKKPDKHPKQGQLKGSKGTPDIKGLLENNNFGSPLEIGSIIPELPGVYCIKVKKYSLLPEPFDRILEEKNTISFILE